MFAEITQCLNTRLVLLQTLYHTICLFFSSLHLNFFCLATPCNLTSRILHGLAVKSIQLPLLSMFTPFYVPYSLVYCCLTLLLYGS